MRERAWRRHMNYKKALRKKKINWYWARDYSIVGEVVPHWYYNNLHQYSKNKIHCSCGVCMAKTRNKRYNRRHVHANYAPNINYSITDKRKLLSMQQDKIDNEI